MRKGGGRLSSSKWFDPRPQSRYNRPYNFVVGVRGGGKSVNTLVWRIAKFIKDGSQFIYLRRRQADLDDACRGTKDTDDLFADIAKVNDFPQFGIKIDDHELDIKSSKKGGYTFYVDGKVAGYGMALSTSKRSSSKPKVNYIIYDEFLIDPTVSAHVKYLNHGDEMFVFDHFYETVARGRDIPVMFIGNAFSMANPFFIEFDIRINKPKQNHIYSNQYYTVYFLRNEEFLADREKSVVFQARKGSKFHQNAFDNSFYLDRPEFVKKRSQDSEHVFSLVYLGKTYGVWADWDKGRYYVSTKGANTSKDRTISMSLADNKPNNINIRRYRNTPAIRAFRIACDNNCVYYDTQQTFNMMNEAVYLLKTIT